MSCFLSLLPSFFFPSLFFSRDADRSDCGARVRPRLRSDRDCRSVCRSELWLRVGSETSCAVGYGVRAVVVVAPGLLTNSSLPPRTCRCTAIGVGTKATADRSTLNTHNNDCADCDFRYLFQTLRLTWVGFCFAVSDHEAGAFVILMRARAFLSLSHATPTLTLAFPFLFPSLSPLSRTRRATD